MIVRALDTDGDWIFGKGRNDYLSGNAAVTQSISTRLKMFLGDCFFSLNTGIDWFNLLGAKNELALQLSVASTILNTKNVVKLIQLSAVLDRDRLETLTYRVETSFQQTSSGEISTDISSLLLDQSGNILTDEQGRPLATG